MTTLMHGAANIGLNVAAAAGVGREDAAAAACERSPALVAMRWSALCESAVDHLWMAIGLALRPFYRTPGFFERRCVARAMHLDPPPHRIEVRHIATAAVNGGKDVLRATLWLPKGQPGPFPTLLMRSPYGAQDGTSEWGQMFLAERGYAVLFQDTRGRFGSDGDFVPVEHEKADGAATVRWIREQPWCDGRVGVIGPSYLGLTAWACVGACAPGELQAAIPTITQAYAHTHTTQHAHTCCIFTCTRARTPRRTARHQPNSRTSLTP